MRQMSDNRGRENGGVGFFSDSNFCVDQAVIVTGSQPVLAASILSHTVPSQAAPSDVVPVTITVRNDGDTSWEATDGITLYSTSNPANFWGNAVVNLPHDVAPGASVRFSYGAKVPSGLDGSYPFSFRMYKSGQGYFGSELTTNIDISTAASHNYSAEIVSHTLPWAIESGGSQAVSVTVRNTGTQPWTTTPAFGLTSNTNVPALWGPPTITLSSTVQSGEETTFIFNVTGPSTAAYRYFKYQMWASGLGVFGESLVFGSAVNAPTNAQIINQSVPTVMEAGSAQNFFFTVENIGSTSWPSDGTIVLASMNAQVDLWGTTVIQLDRDVPPAEQIAFQVPVIAPTAPGQYISRWQMVLDGYGPFGEPIETDGVSVQVSNDGTQPISLDYALFASPCRSTSNNECLKIRGNSENALQFCLEEGFTAADFEECSCEADCPTEGEAYAWYDSAHNDWGSSTVETEEQCFATLASVTCRRRSGTLDATVSTPLAPDSVLTGARFPVVVSVTNTGTATWSRGEGIRLQSTDVPQTAWGAQAIELSEEVRPGETHEFHFEAQAPTTAVSNLRLSYRMLQEGVGYFGESIQTHISVVNQGSLPFMAAIVEHTLPTNMRPGATQTATVVLQNLGSQTWTTGGEFAWTSISSPNDLWGVTSVSVPRDVAPGELVSLQFQVTAPSISGWEHFHFQMFSSHSGLFGSDLTVECLLDHPRTATDVGSAFAVIYFLSNGYSYPPSSFGSGFSGPLPINIPAEIENLDQVAPFKGDGRAMTPGIGPKFEGDARVRVAIDPSLPTGVDISFDPALAEVQVMVDSNQDLPMSFDSVAPVRASGETSWDMIAEAPNPSTVGTFNTTANLAEGVNVDGSTLNIQSNLASSLEGSDPVDAANGEFRHQVTDLVIRGVGLDLAITRSYRSRWSYEGPLGHGWTHSLNQFYEVVPTSCTPDIPSETPPPQITETRSFDRPCNALPAGCLSMVSTQVSADAFCAAEGYTAASYNSCEDCVGQELLSFYDSTLHQWGSTPVAMPSSSSIQSLTCSRQAPRGPSYSCDAYAVHGGDGTVRVFSQPSPGALFAHAQSGASFIDGVLVEQSGVTKRFNEGGKLIEVRDLNGNSISLDWASLLVSNGSGGFQSIERLLQAWDARGNSLVFHYKNNDPTKLERITTSLGHTVSYQIDGQGNLTQAVSADGVAERYEYSPEDASENIYASTADIARSCEQSCSGKYQPFGVTSHPCEEQSDMIIESCTEQCQQVQRESCYDASCNDEALGLICQTPESIDECATQEHIDQCSDTCRANLLTDEGFYQRRMVVSGSCWDYERERVNECKDLCLDGLYETCLRSYGCVDMSPGAAFLTSVPVDSCVGNACFDCNFRYPKPPHSKCRTKNWSGNQWPEVTGGWKCYDNCQKCYWDGKKCPEISAARGRGCMSRCIDGGTRWDCYDLNKVKCPDWCNTAVRNACQEDCTQKARSSCYDACNQIPDTECVSICSSQLVENNYAECEAGCVDGCLDANADPSGYRFGRSTDTAHNLVRVFDGSDDLYVENEYGEDPYNPNFDRVIRHVFGGHEIRYQRHDLKALEAQGTGSLPSMPASVSYDPNSSETIATQLDEVRLCPESASIYNGGYFSVTKASVQNIHSVTEVIDGEGALWLYYADSAGRIVRVVNSLTGSRMDWNYSGNQLLGTRRPDGVRICYLRTGSSVSDVISESLIFPASDGSASQSVIRRQWLWSQFESSVGAHVFLLRGIANADNPNAFESLIEYGDVSNGIGIPTGFLSNAEINCSGSCGSNRNIRTDISLDSDGRLVHENGPLGTTHYDYVPVSGHPDTMVVENDRGTPQSRTITVTYQPDGQVASVVMPGWPTHRYENDNLGRIHRMEEVVDFGRGSITHQTNYTYNSDGLPHIIDRPLVDVEHYYDQRGDLVQLKLTAGSAERMWCHARDARGEVAATLAPDGLYSEYDRNARGDLLAARLGNILAASTSHSSYRDALTTACSAGSGEAVLETFSTYSVNSAGQVTAVQEGEGEGGTQRSYRYDGFGREIETRLSNGYRFVQGYDAMSRVIWSAILKPGAVDAPVLLTAPNPTDAEVLALTHFSYDPLSRLEKAEVFRFVDGPNRTVTSEVRTIMYDDNAGSVTVTEPDGSTVATTYDRYGRMTRQVESLRGETPSQITTERTWSADGRSYTETTTPVNTSDDSTQGTLTRIVRLAMNGEVESVEDETGLVLHRVVFDDYGRPQTISDRSAGEQYTYNPWGEVEAIRRLDNGIASPYISFGYSPGGRPTTATDARGGQFTLYYDAVGRVREREYPDSLRDRITYYGGTNRVNVVSPAGRGVELQHSHDAFGHITEIYDRLNPNDLQRRSYTWGPLGLLSTTALNGPGAADDVSMTYTHDSTGETVTVNDPRFPLLSRKTDELGRWTELEVAPNFFLGRSYDDLGRVRTLTAGSANSIPIASYSYRGLGGPSTIAFDGGTSESWSYDRELRPVLQSLLGINRYYLHGSNGLLVGIGEAGSSTTSTRLFRADGFNRLEVDTTVSDAAMTGEVFWNQYIATPMTSSELSALIPAHPLEQFSYDSADNFSSVSTPRDLVTPSTDSRNLYTSWGSTPIEADAAGRVRRFDSHHYEYSVFNQLNRVATDDGNWTLFHDAFGEIAGWIRPDGHTVHVQRSDDSIIRLKEHNSAGVVVDERFYVPGEGLSPRAVLSSVENGVPVHDIGSSIRYLHSGISERTVVASAPDGSIVERYSWSAYGSPEIYSPDGSTRQTSSIGHRLLLTGQPWLGGPELHGFGQRMYSPRLGRFLTPDPLGIVDGPNQYLYGRAHPWMFIDPLGLSARQSWLGWAGSGVMTALRPVGQAIGYVFTPPGIRDMALRAEAGEQLNLGPRPDLEGWNATHGVQPFGHTQLDPEATELVGRYIEVALGMNVFAGNLTGASMRVGASQASRATRLGARTRGPAVSVRDPSCFVAGTLVLLMGGDASAIDSIRVGDRVETSQGGTETDVDESWRVVHLLGQGYGASGDAFEVTLLRPTAWLEAHGVSGPGADVYLELKEFGFRDWFTVSGLEDAPHIASGPGRVVLSTFTRLSNDVYEVSFGDGVAPLRGTGSHPLYSLDRDDWVRVRDLQLGERLQTAEGAVSVEALEKVRGLHRVYNLEVEGDHEYLVGDAQIRAHNNKVKPGAVPRGGGCPGCPCFSPGTLVTMADGTQKPIEEVKKDDLVLAEDPKGDEGPVPSQVEAALSSGTKSLVYVWTQDDSGDEHRFETTREHPFWTEAHGWVAALELQSGDVLRGITGRRRVLRVEDSGVSSETYNLSVEGLRSYFVGPIGHEVLVHNQDLDFPSSGKAINHALDWLRGQGVDVTKLEPYTYKFGGKGMALPGTKGAVGFRVEFDARNGAHVNVMNRKAIGPHLRFKGNQKSVNTLLRRLYCP